MHDGAELAPEPEAQNEEADLLKLQQPNQGSWRLKLVLKHF